MEQDRLDFFRNLLQERLERLLQEAGETLGDLTEDKEALADALDIATMESNRDFQLGRVGMEVKTTTASSSTHRFENLKQLEPGYPEVGEQEDFLYVASIGLDEIKEEDYNDLVDFLNDEIGKD